MLVNQWHVVRTEDLAHLEPQILAPGVTSYVLDWSSPFHGSPQQPAEAVMRFQPGTILEEPLRHTGPSRIIVLSGRLRDESGSYDPFTRIHAPRGCVHSPYSAIGCLLHFRSLEMGADEDATTSLSGWDVVRPEDLERFQPQALSPGVTGYVLSWSSPSPGPPQPVELIVDFEAGARFEQPRQHRHAAKETLVLGGRLRDENGSYDPFTRIHAPRGSVHTPYSDIGCRVHMTVRAR
ncbi:hypothetical protein DVA86_28070 [Streptomyces armeniacus]|uniref:ChrR-like cupin domain-containing protein n=1 Tax=Streptomyces armeniacus TaxID=83291 RepID=A0A345XW83_9ACTN|nr:cupin domain-containing protein [Streptomyces armeniacus]AXK35899.1 hypothetical protein DVA86_28070 [Streptomyces armeniacus]